MKRMTKYTDKPSICSKLSTVIDSHADEIALLSMQTESCNVGAKPIECQENLIQILVDFQYFVQCVVRYTYHVPLMRSYSPHRSFNRIYFLIKYAPSSISTQHIWKPIARTYVWHFSISFALPHVVGLSTVSTVSTSFSELISIRKHAHART